MMNSIEVVLAKRPVGVPLPEHFALHRHDTPKPGPGEALIRISHWSIDPAMRGWANDVPNYSPPVTLGTPMRSFAVGEVHASNHPNYFEGDLVSGLFGWKTHHITDGSDIERKITETDLPITYALGVLGINGCTAYLGLTSSCEAKSGDTVVVSTAAGAVGSVVGQVAKQLGCRTIGIAGGPEKTALCREAFGYDAAIDYKSDDVGQALATYAPQGVDCYFDNTCGPISDAVMTQLAVGARITVCGTAAETNWDPIPMGPRVHRQLLVARARMQGFLIFDHKEQMNSARAALAGWLRMGAIEVREHILIGPEAAKGAIDMLYKGENKGKLIVDVRSL